MVINIKYNDKLIVTTKPEQIFLIFLETLYTHINNKTKNYKAYNP